LLLLLGILSMVVPFILASTLKMAVEPWLGAAALLVCGIAYVVLLWGIGFKGWFDTEVRAKERWEHLKKTRPRRTN